MSAQTRSHTASRPLTDEQIHEISDRADFVPQPPLLSHGAWAISDRKVLLAEVKRLRNMTDDQEVSR